LSRSLVSLFLLALTGCLHQSPASVLAPMAEGDLRLNPLSQNSQPQCVAFADKLTATVFKKLRHDPRYIVVPTNTPMCPWSIPTTQVCLLRVRIIEMKGDSAIVSMDRTFGQRWGVTYAITYFLLRRGGKWRIDQSINGSIISTG
jgi:hypothetical protein